MMTTGGKPINLGQLQDELRSAGINVTALGMDAERVYCYDAKGVPTDFAEADRSTVNQAIANHVGMRDKTDAEYAVEFRNASTTAERRQEIRDQQSGLLPREQVRM